MSANRMFWQTPAPKPGGGLFFLSLYAAALIVAFVVLSAGADGMWVYFAPGPLTTVWVGGIVALTLGLALMEWVPPALPMGLVWIGIGAIPVLARWTLQGFENSADE